MVGGDQALGAPQPRVLLGARWHVGDNTTLVEHGHGGLPPGGRALDAVPGVARDLGDSGVEGGEGAQRPVAEPVPPGACGEQLAHERPGEQGILGAGDPDGDGLGLVLDGVDGAGELLDAAGEGVGEVLEQHARRSHLAVVELVGVEGDDADGVAQQGCQTRRRARLQTAVVIAGSEILEEAGGQGLQLDTQPVNRGLGVDLGGRRRLDGGARLAQRTGLAVDGEGRLVAEEVAGHRRKDERQLGRHRRHTDHGQGGRERLALGADDHGRRLVGPIDRQLLSDVLGVGAGDAGRAHEDEGLGREVDVLLVFGGIAGDRLVTQLGELDADLRGGNPIRPVADDRPVAPGRRVEVSSLGQLLAPGEHLLHGFGKTLQAGQKLGAPHGIDTALLGHTEGQERAGRHLGVEGLGRRHAHLHVPSVGRVEDGVGLLHQIAVAAVDHGEHGRAPGPDQVHCAVGVGGGAGLADGHHQGVAQVVAQALVLGTEARQLRRRHGVDRHPGRA